MPTHTLRPYGPGKYDTILDSAIHALSLAGCDDEIGDVTTYGWFGLLRSLDESDLCANARLDNDLTDDELAFIREHSAGCIIAENDQGFVSIDYFKSATKRDARWSEIEQDYARFTGDEPDEDSITTEDHQTFYQYGRLAFEIHETATGLYRLHIPGTNTGNHGYKSVEHAIRAYMKRVKFYPNVFFISDHGNAHRMDLE